jgi:hypothetical protein
VKCKTCHGKSQEKGEFDSCWSGFLGLKGGTPIMLGPPYKTTQIKNIHKNACI